MPFCSIAVAGLDPAYMGPIYAIDKLLAKTDKQIDNSDLFELNEVFASQAIISVQE